MDLLTYGVIFVILFILELLYFRIADKYNDLGFVSTERRYEAPMCCTPGASK